MTEETPTGQVDHAAALATRLRAEHAAQADRGIQALLLHECGVLEEVRGEEPVAARDYLAAFNADPQFREPLEALVRILTRRKSLKSLGKLLDALTRAAVTPEERVRAFWEKAAYHQDFDKNFAAAKEALEEAVSANPEDVTSWLELELLSARENDPEGRMRAVEARAELSADATWKALLLIDLAGMHGQAGNAERAYELLGSAAALEGKARFRTQVALEAIAQRDDNLEALSRALEGQADLLIEAIDDGERGDETGVPRFMRKAEFAADAWLRLGEVKRRLGDASGWASCLQRAAELFPDSAAIARARINALESIGELEAAAELSKQELRRVGAIADGEEGATLPPAPAGTSGLWLRLSDAARAAGDPAGSLDALRRALSADAESLPARALELDLLASGEDATALAQGARGGGRGVRYRRSEGARLRARGVRLGLPGERCGSCKSRSFAGGGLRRGGRDDRAAEPGDRGDARRFGVVRGGDETPALCGIRRFGARLLVVRAGAQQAAPRRRSRGARGLPESSPRWAGARSRRGLRAGSVACWGSYAIEIATRPTEEDGTPKPVRPTAEPIEALARVEADSQIARGFWLVASYRRARLGDIIGARAILQDLHDNAAGDEVVAVFLAELARRGGDPNSAANTLAAVRCSE